MRQQQQGNHFDPCFAFFLKVSRRLSGELKIHITLGILLYLYALSLPNLSRNLISMLQISNILSLSWKEMKKIKKQMILGNFAPPMRTSANPIRTLTVHLAIQITRWCLQKNVKKLNELRNGACFTSIGVFMWKLSLFEGQKAPLDFCCQTLFIIRSF